MMRCMRTCLLRLAAWLHRWLARDQFDEIREFVYLDEISVRSLLASTGEGAIATERTERNVQTTRTKHGGSAGVSTGSVGIGASTEAERESQTSVEERKNYDLIQSKFTRLHNSDAVNTRLSLGQVQDGTTPEEFSGLATEDLKRGDIIEVRVDVSAHFLFRLYQTIDYFADALEGKLDQDLRENLRLIEVGLGDAIPIEGTAIDYQVVEDHGRKTIKLKSDIDKGSTDPVHDLKIVTLLNLTDLWADPIYTLFNEDEFVIYCRIEDIDVDVWHPLKATRAIGSLSQNAAEMLNDQILSGLDEVRNQLSQMQGLEDWSSDSVTGWAEDIEEYIKRLKEKCGADIEFKKGDQQQLIQEAHQHADITYEDSTVAQRKEVLNAYTDAFEEKFEVEIDSDLRAELRAETHASVDLVNAPSTDENDVFRVEAKTVALYW